MRFPRLRPEICVFLMFAAIPITRAQQRAPADIRKIDHVVFIVKENRTYDNMFGTFNATYGTKKCVLSNGEVVPMSRAADRYPHDIDHSFAAAVLAMNGDKMNQFDLINLGNTDSGDLDGDLLTCRQFIAADIPNYFTYA